MEVHTKLLDGKHTAKVIRTEIKNKIEQKMSEDVSLKPPKLAVVIVGDRVDSHTYVSMKIKACEECGIVSVLNKLPSTISQEDLEHEVYKLEEDIDVVGILIQLPLPAHIIEAKVLGMLTCNKDVDGLHPMNVGRLALKGMEPFFKPCTAMGCVELCKRYGIALEGKHVVVLGRSNIVGLPVSLLFQQENATVTMCHSKTNNLAVECQRADILIAAIGKAEFVKPNFIKEGAVVIDVGINSKPDTTRKSGYRLIGDVEFESCQSKCSYITPVPGGIGPMTVAMLMQNTYNAWKELHNLTVS